MHVSEGTYTRFGRYEPAELVRKFVEVASSVAEMVRKFVEVIRKFVEIVIIFAEVIRIIMAMVTGYTELVGRVVGGIREVRWVVRSGRVGVRGVR